MVENRIKTIAEMMQDSPSREMVQKIFLTLDYNPGGPDGIDEPYIDNKSDFGIASAQFIAHYAEFGIIHLEMARTSLKDWKTAAKHVFKDYIESMVICTAPGENRLLLSNHYQSRRKGEPIFESRMRHIPLDVEDEVLSRPVKEWLDAISIPDGPKLNTFELMERINGAFDNYAKQLQNNLQENVYEALRSLAQGLIDVKKNKVKPTREGLEEAREELFFLLYRILFVLYAEDRGLLPIDNKNYFEKYSIANLKKELILPIDKGKDQKKLLKKVVPDGLWTHLDNLFELINLGSEGLGIDDIPMPTYNGRLFSNVTAEGVEKKLAKWNFTDDSLVDTLSFLFRAEDRDKNPFFINYSTLETRHLGSVYEGLLEYRLRIAEEPMIAVKSGKTLAWKPASEAGSGRTTDRVETGAIYLETDKGERKATGSYYTPNYIVEYIVENTVAPLVRQKLAEAHASCEAQGLLGSLPETRESGISPKDYGELVAAQPDSMKQDGARDAAWNAILSLNVLDPAMGSGHFLVGALHYLAQVMVTCDGEAKDNQEKRFIDAKREAVRRCLYGVDLNPLAVELAKVSLWLETVASEKPLSFLDHHLKCGNSLIGARLEDLHVFPDETVKGKKKRRAPKLSEGQDFFEVTVPKPVIERFTKAMQKVEGLTDDNIEAVHEKEDAYITLKRSPEYLKIRELCDLKTSLYFDNDMGGYDPKTSYQNIVRSTLKDNEEEWKDAKDRAFMQNACALAKEKRFFHWELEFPEIFYVDGKHKDEEAGFNAVIGNPPYIRVETLESELADYYKEQYVSVYERCDIYIAFIELSILLNNKNGLSGLITPNQFIVAEYGKKIRGLLADRKYLHIMVDFTHFSVFSGITTYCNIIILSKGTSREIKYVKIKSEKALRTIEKRGSLDFEQLFDVDEYMVNVDTLDETPWKLLDTTQHNIFQKIYNQGIKLKDISKTGSPLTSGRDELLVGTINSETKFFYNIKLRGKNVKVEKDIWKKLLRPKRLKRWISKPPIHVIFFPYQVKEEKFVLINENEFKSNYPLTYGLMTNHKSDLENRLDSRKSWLELNRVWYSLHRVGKPSLFFNHKILTPSLLVQPNFSKETDGVLFPHGGVFGIVNNIFSIDYVLSVLNSKTLLFVLKQISPLKRGGWISIDIKVISQIPIRRIFFHTPAAERKAAVARLQKHYVTGSSPYEPLLVLVEECLPREADGTFAAFGPRAVSADDGLNGLDANHEPLERSDVVHDLLAFLAEQMMTLNQQKQVLVRKALDGVAAETGLSVEEWKLKTKMQKFWQEPESEWVRAMQDHGNAKRFTNTGKKSEDKIVRNLSKAKEKLQPILEKIDDTDKLIDQIVYRLYGLTKEEIAIVEGST